MGVFRRPTRAGGLAENYSVRYTLADGKTRRTVATQATTEAEALEILKKYEESVQQEKIASFRAKQQESEAKAAAEHRGSLKLSSALDRAYEEHWQYNKVGEKPVALIKAIIDLLGDVSLSEIGPDFVSKLRSKLSQKGLAISTVNRHLAALKTLLRMAHYDWELIERLPRIKLFSEKGNERDFVYSDELIERIKAHFNDVGLPEMADLTLFLNDTGVRLSEALRLSWGNVNLNERTITLVRKLTKGKASRVIPLTTTAYEVLVRRQSAASELAAEGTGPFDWSIHTVEKRWSRMREVLGLSKDAVLHCLRHTFATRLTYKGNDLYTVQKLLGHSTPAITTRYSHLKLDTLRVAVESLD